jgi:putative SOS response-associated peptidase YedK
MCGRITRTSPQEAIAKEFGVTRFAEVDWRPHYNVAPSQTVETIISVNGEKRLGPMRWGFVSTTGKEPKLAPINARAETLSTSPMFRDAFRRHRCLVVADGFYEWRKNDGRRRTPFFIRLKSGRPFGFAGIWSMKHGEKEKSTRHMRHRDLPAERAHGQNPRPDAGDPTSGCPRRAGDPTASETELRGLLAPLAAGELNAYEVSALVNSPANDSPECVRPVLPRSIAVASPCR